MARTSDDRPARRGGAKLRFLRFGAIFVLAALALAQLVPYGRDHSNPPVTGTPHWDSARTAALVHGACADCHGNQTRWPWYASVAPSSWLTEHDVQDARRRLNFSEWDRPQPGLDELVRQIRSGSMPPLQYKLIHGEARLSSHERDELIRGLTRTYARGAPPHRPEGRHEGGD